jgi:1-acyl-sn-glycerol-3-phosphate acyltransferase
MAELFVHIFVFFQRRKKVFFLCLFTYTALAVFLVAHIRFENDLTKILPKNSGATDAQQALSNVRLTDRILLVLSLTDSASTNTDKLAQTAEIVVEKLEALRPEYVRSITGRIADDKIGEIMDLFYENLPLYLSDEDYSSLDSLLHPESIQSTLRSDYKTLLTPAGSFMKKSILRDPLNITPRTLKKLRNLQFDSKYTLNDGWIFSENSKQLILYLDPSNPSGNGTKNAELNTKLQEISETLGNDVRMEFFGAPLVAAGNETVIKKDVTVTMCIVGICIFLFLGFFYRKFSYFFIIIVPVLYGGISSLAILSLLRSEGVSSMSIGMGAILLGITIDYSLHVFTHFRKLNDIRAVLRDVSGSMLLSSLTTVVAFFSLLFTGSVALHDLGLFAGFSILFACLASLIILPQLLSPRNSHLVENDHTIVDTFTSFPFHKIKILNALIFTISVVSIVFFRTPEFESNMEKMNYMSPELAASEKTVSALGDHTKRTVFLIATGKNADEALKNAERVIPRADSLKRIGSIGSYATPTILMSSRDERQKRVQKWQSFWTAEKRANTMKHLEQEALSLGFKPGSFHLFDSLINRDFSKLIEQDSPRLKDHFLFDLLTVSDSSSTALILLKVSPEKLDAIPGYFDSFEGISVFDKRFMLNQLMKALSDDFQIIVNLSLCLVFLILLISYGRIELALITLLPMLLSWFWTIGLMNLTGLTFNIINIIISSFIFGLGIDYSIFIMNGMIQDYRSGRNHLNSYKTSIFLSAFTTILGVGGMIFARHPALKSIALLSVSGIGIVLILSYTLIPLLFGYLVTNRTKKGLEPLTFLNAFHTLLAWVMILIGFTGILLLSVPVSALIFLKPGQRKFILHVILCYWARGFLKILPGKKFTLSNPNKESFTKPALIVANHQSFLDVVCMFALSPRIILTENSRIYNNPIFGPVSRLCGFINISGGIENLGEVIKSRMTDGYSVVVFPEGTRSTDNRIHRFHKGAFLIAEQLQADILPVIFHGTGEFLSKKSFWGKNTAVFQHIDHRITHENPEFSFPYSERSKRICRHMRQIFEKIKIQEDIPKNRRNKLMLNYIYLSPVLEWYMRVKLMLEKEYTTFHKLLPLKGKIYDLGCGYGMMTYMLALTGPEREIIACDYDTDKVETAEARFLKTDRLNFQFADLNQFKPEQCNGIVISDALHYLLPQAQERLLRACAEALLPGGVLIIKDGDALHADHSRTNQTEVWSTRIIKFNKSTSHLHFTNHQVLKDFADAAGLSFEFVEQRSGSSNCIWAFHKPEISAHV